MNGYNQYEPYEENYSQTEYEEKSESSVDETTLYNDGEDKKPKLIIVGVGIVLLLIIILIILFACSKKTDNKVSLNLTDITISNSTISPEFNKNVLQYEVSSEKDSVIVRCVTESNKVTVSGCNKQIYLSDVCQRHTIKVMTNNDSKEYILNMCKKNLEAPIVKEIAVKPSEYTNKEVKVIIKAESNVPLHSEPYSIDDGNTWQSSNEFIVTENKTLNIKVRNKDNVEASVTKEINNIDNVKPSVKVSGSIKSGVSTTSNVELTAEVTPDSVKSGYKYQWYNGNTKIKNATKSNYLATTSGSYKVVVTTGSGNTATSNVYKVSIKKYNNTSNNNAGNNKPSDKPTTQKPTDKPNTQEEQYVLAVTSIEGNASNWTNNNVTLTVKTKSSNGLHSQAYSFDGGKTFQTSNSKTFTSNQTVNIVVRDKKGKTTSYQSKITKIDKTKPTISVSGTLYTKSTLTANVTPASASSGYSYQWYKDNKIISGATSKAYTPTEAGTYKVVVKTGAGLSTEYGNIRVINKILPTVTLTSSATSGKWTNSNITLNAAIKNGKATKYEWYKDNALYKSCTSTSCVLSTTQNSVYKVRAVTSEGNTSFSSTFTVKIDKTAPSAPKVVLSSTKKTTKDITFKITAGKDNESGVSKTQYSFDKKTWKTYKAGSSIDLLTNTGVKTVYARTLDQMGNISSIVSDTGKCDKDETEISRYSNGKNDKGCWVMYNLKLANTGLTGITKNKYEYAYWNPTKTTHTTSKDHKLVDKKCGTSPPKGVSIKTTTNARTDALYLKYSNQYACVAVRPYRSKEISGLNRWTVYWAFTVTQYTCPSSAYTGK